MSRETNRRAVLRTAAGVAGAASLSPLPSVGNENYQAVSQAPAVAPANSGRRTPASAVPRLGPTHRHGTLVAPDEACGIAFWSRPAGPLLVRRPRTDPHPKGKDPS
ncbi:MULTISPECIES: hypothetical protein [Streptomyces]|uniref:Uncharacterized protein n=1 Tax=Streptomyces chartreusis NRRL 3882 TaxID=1079985 RepID=A0A2N9BLP7_STRCX|nr:MULTISPECIES: hypothetical protein [Streptomyces]MYS88660.1 hypothetical protein [Streptomyces sp. SID5464]SOR84283.1 hypothetical protein SCNRRL3882_7728 [Streptomyces chartreusis NRRL 3882]